MKNNLTVAITIFIIIVGILSFFFSYVPAGPTGLQKRGFIKEYPIKEFKVMTNDASNVKIFYSNTDRDTRIESAFKDKAHSTVINLSVFELYSNRDSVKQILKTDNIVIIKFQFEERFMNLIRNKLEREQAVKITEMMVKTAANELEAHEILLKRNIKKIKK